MSSYDNKRYHSRDGDYRDRDRDYRRDRDERDRRRRDSSSDNPPADPIKKALEGFSIPKKSVSDSVNETSPPKKSLSESINNRLLNLSSTPSSSCDDKVSEYSSDRGSGRKGAVGSFCAGKKRRFEEISSSQSWAKKYDKTIPDDIMMLCSNDRCDLCGVDITSPKLRDDHYSGAKHEKKVRARLAELFPEEADRPKKAKIDNMTDSGVAAALSFLQKIEDQVERDPGETVSYSDNKLEEWQRLWMEKWSAPLPAQIVAMCRIVRCDICEAAFNSGIMARSHYEGKNHEKKLRACLEMYCRKHGLEVPARVTTEAEETFETHCKVCDVELTSDAMAKIHYAGKKHIERKLKQSRISATEDRTGRFGIGAGFAQQQTDSVEDANDDLKDVLRSEGASEGLDGTWGDTPAVKTEPVPLMSLKMEAPKPNLTPSPPKPKVLGSGSSDYSCEVCNVGCLGSRQNWEAHMQGKSHRKKVRDQETQKFFCEDCNVTCANQAIFETHIRGKQHAKKREQGEDRVEGGQLNCDLCMVTCCTEDQLRIHIGGKKHQAKTRTNSESIFKCSVCNITTTDQNGLTMHLQGKAHQAALKKGGFSRSHY